MKHRKSERTLGRTATHRERLWRELTGSLLEHGAIVTTEAKAKELRRHVEPLIERAKGETTLQTRRVLGRQVRNKEDLARLLEVAAESKERHGGYVRLTRVGSFRSDGAVEMRVSLVDAE